MDFSTSLSEVKLDDQETLVAKCENSRHEWELSSFPLNEYLGNNDGHFAWRWQGLKQTARNVYLREGRFLHAELQNAGGGWNATSVDLSEYIENQDGALWCKDEKQEFLAGDDWHIADCYMINEAFGLCLDLAGEGDPNNGAKVHGWTFMQGNENQIWRLEKVNKEDIWSTWTVRNIRTNMPDPFPDLSGRCFNLSRDWAENERV